jgi:hypothetical protein
VATTALAAPSADAQKLVQGYVAKQKQKVRSTKSQTPKTAARATGKKKSVKTRLVASAHKGKLIDKVESQSAKSLGGGVHALFVKSQLKPGQFDRYHLFKVDKAGRATKLSKTKVFEDGIRDMPLTQLTSLWRESVATIRTDAYRQNPKLRTLVETELHFLEKHIEKLAPSARALPWRTQRLDPIKELNKVGNGKKLAKTLAKGRAVERGTLEMIKRGVYKVHSLESLPKSEFLSMIRSVDMQEIPEIRAAKASHYPQLRQKNSALRKAIEREIAGFQFAKQRSVLILGQKASATLQTIVHEFNHGANRIPEKTKYSGKEVLASEFAAFGSEKRLSKQQLGKLKSYIVSSYELKRVKANAVPESPRGVPNNWVPRFPKGQEKAYQKAFFEAP